MTTVALPTQEQLGIEVVIDPAYAKGGRHYSARRYAFNNPHIVTLKGYQVFWDADARGARVFADGLRAGLLAERGVSLYLIGTE